MKWVYVPLCVHVSVICEELFTVALKFDGALGGALNVVAVDSLL
jgi:hypothetical protein